MDDLISRQAAIDAFGLSEKTRKYGGDHSGYGTMMLYEIQDTLKSLPSAQPEIIRCKDCREFRRWIDTDITFCDLTESERDALDFCSRAERRTG